MSRSRSRTPKQHKEPATQQEAAPAWLQSSQVTRQPICCHVDSCRLCFHLKCPHIIRVCCQCSDIRHPCVDTYRQFDEKSPPRIDVDIFIVVTFCDRIISKSKSLKSLQFKSERCTFVMFVRVLWLTHSWLFPPPSCGPSLIGFEVNCVVCPFFVSSTQTTWLTTMLRSKLLSIRRVGALMGRSEFRRWEKETPSGST